MSAWNKVPTAGVVARSIFSVKMHAMTSFLHEQAGQHRLIVSHGDIARKKRDPNETRYNELWGRLDGNLITPVEFLYELAAKESINLELEEDLGEVVNQIEQPKSAPKARSDAFKKVFSD